MDALAAITDAQGGFRIDRIKIGDPGPGDVLVQIKAAGVCHTDWDIVTRRRDHVVMGHEGAGVVQGAGHQVTTAAPGDRVVLNWAIPCGNCYQCRLGNENICENKPKVDPERITYQGQPILPAFALGTMSPWALVPQAAVTRIPDAIDISFSSAAILGCGVMTGVGSVINACNVTTGSSVVVLGAGGVGLSVVQGARIAGASQIIAVDINPQRLSFAKQFGATDCILVQGDDTEMITVAEKVRTQTSGRGADYAFECVAKPELAAAPLRMIRNGGTAVGVSGIESSVEIDMELFEWDKIYINPLYGKCRPAIDFPRLLDWYDQGRLMLDQMVTQTYALDALADAFDDMHAGRIAKGVITFDDGGYV